MKKRRVRVDAGVILVLVLAIPHATVDVSAFSYRVISPNLVLLYGSPTTTVTFADGSVVTLPPLPQTLAWVRQGGDPSRPFVVVADHESRERKGPFVASCVPVVL